MGSRNGFSMKLGATALANTPYDAAWCAAARFR